MSHPPRGPYSRVPFNGVVVLDTETTGLWPYGIKDDGTPSGDPEGADRMCSLAMLRLGRNREGWQTLEKVRFFVDPERGVSKEASAVNGFVRVGYNAFVPPNARNLIGLPNFGDVADAVQKFIGGWPVVMHNAPFDFAVLDAEFARAARPMLGVGFLCTKMAFSDMLGLGRPARYVPGTNLNKLCDILGVDRSGRIGADGLEAHGADVDAEMAANCFISLDEMGWMVLGDADALPHRGGTAV